MRPATTLVSRCNVIADAFCDRGVKLYRFVAKSDAFCDRYVMVYRFLAKTDAFCDRGGKVYRFLAKADAFCDTGVKVYRFLAKKNLTDEAPYPIISSTIVGMPSLFCKMTVLYDLGGGFIRRRAFSVCSKSIFGRRYRAL